MVSGCGGRLLSNGCAVLGGLPMKCICGGAMKVSTENYEYESLPGAILCGVEVRRCATCDEEEVLIPRLAELNRVIAGVLIRKPTPLSPAEFRFLRKSLGWSGVDVARRFGVAKETVSRWEKGRMPIAPPADRLLRLTVAYESPIQDYGRRGRT